MNKATLLSLLTGALALGSTSTTPSALETQLGGWAEKHLSVITESARELVTPPFTLNELQELAAEAVIAANDLKGVLAGTQRAKVAQTILVAGVKYVAPDALEPWVLPFLEGAGLAAIIESAFLKLFPEKAQPAPVVDASDVEPGGVQ